MPKFNVVIPADKGLYSIGIHADDVDQATIIANEIFETANNPLAYFRLNDSGGSTTAKDPQSPKQDCSAS